MADYETFTHDVLVIGAGGAGLRAAIEASAAGVKVGMVCKSLLGKAHTGMAEGGIAAALANAADGEKVTTESHAAVEKRMAVLGMRLERYPVEEFPQDGARNEFEQYVRRYDVPTEKRSPLGLQKTEQR